MQEQVLRTTHQILTQCAVAMRLLIRGQFAKRSTTMAWEERRNGRLYYYRKVREGRRVRSIYVGSGLLGDLAEEQLIEDADLRQERRRLRAHDANQARVLNEIERSIRALLDDHLESIGLRKIKRQWK